MRRILGVTVALLAAGCGLRPWTPSVSVAFWAEDVPAGTDVSLPSSMELARAWQLPSDVAWSRYTKGTLMSSIDPMGSEATLPDVRSLEIVAKAQEAATNVARGGMPANTLWVVDLRGAASCAFASTLSEQAREPVAPVVTFNNWPADESVVPADETLAGLLAFKPKRLPEETKRAAPVFLLDSWRLAYRFDKPSDDVYDNRYILMAGDLPDVATLRAQGITRIVYLVEDLDDAEVEEDDLHQSFAAWQAGGLGIFMVDLAFLNDVPAPRDGQMWIADWNVRLAPEAYRVRDRYTLVDDPVFYTRARAGFGFAYGRPAYRGRFRGGGGYGYGSGGHGGHGMFGGGSGG